MKKFTYIFLLPLAILLCSSCGEAVTPATDGTETLQRQYDISGEAHNEALDLVYEEFARQKENGYLSSDLTECCEQAVNILRGARLSGLRTELVLKNGTLIPEIIPGRRFAKNASNEDVVNMLSDSLDIFREYQGVFDSIALILDSPAGTEQKHAELTAFYVRIDNTVENEKDKTVLMYFLSTVIHSLDYWETHMQEWRELFTCGMQKPAMGIVGAVGIIDGAGAVIGAVEGFCDTEPGEEGRAWKIVGRAVGEAANASLMATLSIILL
ncbi:MAG: hypothetical protein U5N26_03880 [Candidatus Marinimicrobia bacterium]|nr:hypothetical protein [Candidatus Neomarinimicrobiota bacterium]